METNFTSNGSFGTLVFYRGNSNYQILFGRSFIVKNSTPIVKIKHMAKTDDTNYVFELFSSKLAYNHIMNTIRSV